MADARQHHSDLPAGLPREGWLALGLALPVAFCACLAFEEPLWLLGPVFILLAMAGMLVRSGAAFLLGLFPFLCIHHVSGINVLFSTSGILLLALERTLKREGAERITGIETGLVLAALLALHPVPGAPSASEAFGQWIYDYAPLLLYVLLARSGLSAEVVSRTVRLLLFASIAASLTVVADGLLHPDRRAIGIVQPSPTGVAYDLVMFIPIGLGLFAAGGRGRLLGASAALLALAAVFFTGSRTPFVAALVLSLPFARGHRLGLPLVGLLVLAAMAQTGGGIVSRLAAIQGEGGPIGASTLMRIVLWGLSIQILQSHAWLGIGFGQFKSYARGIYEHHTLLLGHSHNVVLEKMVQVGIPLATFYLALIAALLLRNWRSYRSVRGRLDAGERELFRGMFLGVLAMLACGATDAVLNGTSQPLLFWVVMALLTLWTERLRERHGGGCPA
jgi:O-antigen ligase